MSGWTWAVALRHRLAGASSKRSAHVDLIINAGRRCPTLRIDARGAQWSVAHRRHYVTYRGAVPGGRGWVTPLWRGRCWIAGRCLRWQHPHRDQRMITRALPPAARAAVDRSLARLG